MRRNQAILIVLGSIVTAAIVVFTIFGGLTTGSFLFLLAAFVGLSILFIRSVGRFQPARLFEMPVFLTVLALVNFGFAPLQALIMPEKLNENLHGDTSLLLTALLLVIAGMVAFWAACIWTAKRGAHSRAILTQNENTSRLILVAICLYAIGFVCKTVLLRSHMYHYTTSFATYYNDLAYAQVLMFGSQLSTIALVMIAVEHYTRPEHRLSRWLLSIFFASECVWGLISGMKSVLLINLLAVAIVSTVIKGKLAKKWILTAVLGLIVIYPFYNSYRSVLRGRGSDQVTDFASAGNALGRAATESFSGSSESWIKSGSDSSVSRVDLLQYFALALSLGDNASRLHGDERLWMIPVYPFVPRVLWPSKPILDQGARFSDVLGWGDQTATALPYFADWFIYAGVPGLLGGMFLLGILAQRYTNYLYGHVSKYHVMKYTVIFVTCLNFEMGAFMFWTTFLKLLAVLFVIRFLAYSSVKSAARFSEVRLAPSLRVGAQL